MNKKVNLIFSGLTAMFFLVLVSCGGGSSDNPIVGKWKVVKAEGTAASLNEGQEYVFKDDGKAVASNTDYTYTYANDTLKMDYQGAGSIIITWVCIIEGAKMTLDNASNTKQTLWLEKR